MQFIDDYRETYGVEPICRVLPITPSTYYAFKECEADPEKRSPRVRRDEELSLCTDWGRLWRDEKYDPWDDEAPGRVTAVQAVERYLAQHGGAEETLKSYRTTLEPFIATLSPGLSVSEIQPRHVRHFIEQPQLSGSTPNAYFNRLRSFYGYCLEKRWVYEDPTGSIARPPEASSSTRSVFLPHELDRILIAAAADVVLRPERTICLFAYELAAVTRMRLGALQETMRSYVL